MAGNRFPYPRFKGWNGSAVNASGKLYIYLTGTTTKVSAGFALDARGGSDVANPLILDSDGEGDLWLKPGTQYTLKMDTSADVQIWSKDGISAFDLESWVVSGSDISYQAGQVGIGGAAGSEALKVTGTCAITSTLAVSGALSIPADSTKMIWGAGSDCSIQYDGTNMVITPNDAGSGSVVIANKLDASGSMLKTSAAVGVTINETGSSLGDFRVESDNDTHMIFLDASGDDLMIGGSVAGTPTIARFQGSQITHSQPTLHAAKTTFVAATTSIPSINIPHGTAPSSPTNGDMWTTTAGLYVRINGGTVGPLS